MKSSREVRNPLRRTEWSWSWLSYTSIRPDVTWVVVQQFPRRFLKMMRGLSGMTTRWRNRMLRDFQRLRNQGGKSRKVTSRPRLDGEEKKSEERDVVHTRWDHEMLSSYRTTKFELFAAGYWLPRCVRRSEGEEVKVRINGCTSRS